MMTLLANIPNQIDKIAFTIGKLEVRWYAIILTSAMLIALCTLYFLAKKKGFTSDFVLEVFLWTIPLAIIFARLGYVIPREEYWSNPDGFARIFKIWEGGLTILTGIFGGLLGIFIACKHKKVALFDMVDIVIPALLIGQAVGRWGNFMNEELFGMAITNPNLQWLPFAVYIHNPGGGLEPGWYAASFFYESIMNLVMGVFMILFVYRGKYKPGQISAMYLAWYGFLRGMLEFIKIGAYKIGGVIGGAQIFSFGMCLAGIILLILIVKNKIKINTTQELRLKKQIEYVNNDAFKPGKFNSAFNKQEQLEMEEIKAVRHRRNREKRHESKPMKKNTSLDSNRPCDIDLSKYMNEQSNNEIYADSNLKSTDADINEYKEVDQNASDIDNNKDMNDNANDTNIDNK